MPLFRSTEPLISTFEGVYFRMVHMASTRRVEIRCVVTRMVLHELAGRALPVFDHPVVFASCRAEIEQLASDAFDRARGRPQHIVTVGLRDLNRACKDGRGRECS